MISILCVGLCGPQRAGLASPDLPPAVAATLVGLPTGHWHFGPVWSLTTPTGARTVTVAPLPAGPVPNSQQAVNHTVGGVRAGQRSSPPSPRYGPCTRRTQSAHRPAANRRRGRSADRGIQPASAATPGSPSSPRRCRTRSAPHRPTWGSGCRPGDDPPPEHTPVKWIAPSLLIQETPCTVTGNSLHWAGVGACRRFGRDHKKWE